MAAEGMSGGEEAPQVFRRNGDAEDEPFIGGASIGRLVKVRKKRRKNDPREYRREPTRREDIEEPVGEDGQSDQKQSTSRQRRTRSGSGRKRGGNRIGKDQHENNMDSKQDES